MPGAGAVVCSATIAAVGGAAASAAANTGEQLDSEEEREKENRDPKRRRVACQSEEDCQEVEMTVADQAPTPAPKFPDPYNLEDLDQGQFPMTQDFNEMVALLSKEIPGICQSPSLSKLSSPKDQVSSVLFSEFFMYIYLIFFVFPAFIHRELQYR
jgi:hypothetical protein